MRQRGVDVELVQESVLRAECQSASDTLQCCLGFSVIGVAGTE
jgi:hypothetical protein